MTFISLSLFAACLLLWDVEAQRREGGVLACRASGRLGVSMVWAYRGTGRLGCYRVSERG